MLTRVSCSSLLEGGFALTLNRTPNPLAPAPGNSLPFPVATGSPHTYCAGFAFVYMRDRRDAEEAIRKLDRREFGVKRRLLKVEWAQVRKRAGVCVCSCLPNHPILLPPHPPGGAVSCTACTHSYIVLLVPAGCLDVSQAKPEDGKRAELASRNPSTTLFVVGFDSRSTRISDLERQFERYGRLKRVDIKKNFAFVQFEDLEDSRRAQAAMHDSAFRDRRLTVEFVVKEPFNTGGGGGGGASGRGRSRSRSPARRGSPRYRSRSPPRRSRSPPRYRSRSPAGGRAAEGRSASPSPVRGRSRSPRR